MSRKRTNIPSPTPVVHPVASVERPSAAAVVLILMVLLVPFIGGYVLMEPAGADGLVGILTGMFGTEKDMNMAAGITLSLAGLALMLHKPVKKSGRYMTMLIVMAVWVVVCAVASPYHADAVRQAGCWLAALAVIAVVSRLSTSGKQQLMAAITLAGSLVAFMAVREYMGNLRSAPDWRVFGPFQSPNILAAYLCLTLPLTLGWLSQEIKAELRLLLMIGWGIQVSALVLTGSRFGILSAVIGVLIWLVWLTVQRQWDRRRVLSITRALAFGLIIAVLCTAPLKNRMGTAPNAGTQEHSGQFRAMTWKGTVNMVKAHPVTGVGPGCFAYGYARNAITGYTRTAHQSYLQLASELGVPGLLLWLGIGLGSLVVLVRSRQQLIPAPLMAGVAAGVVASGCHALMDSDWQILAVLMTLSVLVGLCYVPNVEMTDRPAHASARKLTAVLALVVGLWVCLGAYYAQIGQTALRSGDAPKATSVYNKLLALWPFDGTAMLNKAMSQMGDPSINSADKIKLVERACSLMPTPRNYMMAAKMADGLQNPEKALVLYDQVLKVDPVSPRGYVRYAALLERLRMYPKAAVIYQMLVELEKSPAGQIRAVPELPETDFIFGHGGLARDAALRGKKRQAAEHYQEVLRLLAADVKARDANPTMNLAKPREMSDGLDALEREARSWLGTDH